MARRSDTHTGPWPGGARAALAFTLDNMGEAADLNRELWPDSEPVGQHYSVTTALPKLLRLLKQYDISATYFIESWNTNVYGDFILNQIVAAGHEVAWHAWQHEAWSKLKDEAEEVANFERSFGQEGIEKWTASGKCEPYSGFRPPGGIIHGERTLKLCRKHGLKYLSPAGQTAATVEVGGQGDRLTILPFRWGTVDAYFYMDSFAGLRDMKGEYGSEPQPPSVLVQRYIAEVDEAIEAGGFRSLLFHPFLTNSPQRWEAMESVLQYLVKKRNAGKIWLARCKDIDEFIRKKPGIVGVDPGWDMSSWR